MPCTCQCWWKETGHGHEKKEQQLLQKQETNEHGKAVLEHNEQKHVKMYWYILLFGRLLRKFCNTNKMTMSVRNWFIPTVIFTEPQNNPFLGKERKEIKSKK